MVRHVFGEWWKNHILHQHVIKKKENETYLDDNLKLSKTMSFENRVFKNDRQCTIIVKDNEIGIL